MRKFIFVALFLATAPAQALMQNSPFSEPSICEVSDWYESAMQKIANRFNGIVENSGDQEYTLYVESEEAAYRIPFMIYEHFDSKAPGRLFYKVCLITE